MRKIGFVADSTLGLDAAFVKKHDIKVVNLSVIVDQETFEDGVDINNDQLLEFMAAHKNVTTSQPSPAQFLTVYEALFADGVEDVFVMTISQSLSGTYNSAMLARDMIGDKLKNVHVFDSQSCSAGGEYLFERAILFAEKGLSAIDLVKALEEERLKGSLLFTVDNLNALVRNGRLSKTSALIGNVLKIKPILRFKVGVLDLEQKVRSKKGVFDYLLNEVETMTKKGKTVVRITYVNTQDLAEELKTKVKELYDNVEVKVVNPITTVVSAHIGKGGLGFYVSLV